MRNKYGGLAILDSNNRIRLTNNAFDSYLGRDPKDTIGRRLSEIVDNVHFKKQLTVFETQKGAIAADEFPLEPFVFQIGEVPMTGMYFTHTKGKSPHRRYGGAAIMLIPHKSKTLIEKILDRGPVNIKIGETVTIENMVEYLRPMFESGKRRVIIDMRYTKRIDETVVRRFADCYHAIKRQKFGCSFINVPRSVKEFFERLEKPVHEVGVLEKPEKVLYSPKEMDEYTKGPKQEPPQEAQGRRA